MNRGVFGVSRGKGKVIGMQHMWLGAGSPGNLTEALGAGAYKQYARKVVPPKSGFLASIDAYVFAPAGNVQGACAAVLKADDSLGSLPTSAQIISSRGAGTTASVALVALNMNTVPRWLSVHVGTYLQGGQPYWLVFNGGNGLTIAYSDDTSLDASAAGNITWTYESGITYTLQNKRYSIRGSFIY